jgi:hypothetical protein
MALGTSRPTTRSNTRKKIKQFALKITPKTTMISSTPTPKLFAPLRIADGKIELKHRVVMAPMTRNRGIPLAQGTKEAPNRTWLPDELVAEYYEQRASEGGLLITEGIPPSIEARYHPETFHILFLTPD